MILDGPPFLCLCGVALIGRNMGLCAPGHIQTSIRHRTIPPQLFLMKGVLQNMKSLLVLVFLISATVVLAAQDKPQASVSAKPKQIEQGNAVTISVKLSPAPSIDGIIVVSVAQENEPTQTVHFNSGVPHDQSNIDVSVPIPPEAKTGMWKVVLVEFLAPNATKMEPLNLVGTARFEVVKHEVRLPKTADVQVK